MSDPTFKEDVSKLPSGRIRVMTAWPDDSMRWFTAEIKGLTSTIAEYAVESESGDFGPDGDCRPSSRGIADAESKHVGEDVFFIYI